MSFSYAASQGSGPRQSCRVRIRWLVTPSCRRHWSSKMVMRVLRKTRPPTRANEHAKPCLVTPSLIRRWSSKNDDETPRQDPFRPSANKHADTEVGHPLSLTTLKLKIDDESPRQDPSLPSVRARCTKFAHRAFTRWKAPHRAFTRWKVAHQAFAHPKSWKMDNCSPLNKIS